MAEISGYWKFNDVPTVKALSENVEFRSYNASTEKYENFYGFYIASAETYMNYGTTADLSSRTWVFRTSDSFWRADQCKIVDFGTDAKTVSDTFYTWFIANATEIERPTLEGIWLLNEKMSNGVMSNIVPFVSNGKLYTKMVTSSTKIAMTWICLNFYSNTDTTFADADNIYYFTAYEGNPAGWTNTAYRTIEFVPTEQVGTYELYDWINANAVYQGATKDTKPVYINNDGEWLKKNAYERKNGEWVQISYAN